MTLCEPPALRVLRSALALPLALACTFLLGLALIGWSSLVREALKPLFFYGTDGVSGVALGLTIAFILLTPTALFVLATRTRRLNWRTLAIGWAVVIPALVWLAWDDPAIRRPLAIDEISPAFDGAEKSYAVLMRYSKGHPSPEAQSFSKIKLAFATRGYSVGGKEWPDFITRNRAAIEADWATLNLQREWFTKLNTFERIGDLAPARFDGEIIAFQVWRALSGHACAIASLQVLDGNGDDALATILPFLEVGKKLEPSSRSIARTMIALVVQRSAQATISFILDRHDPSPALRSRLADALAPGKAAAGARRLILVEYAGFSATIPLIAHGNDAVIAGVGFSITAPVRLLSPLLFNPNATANLYGDRLYELASLAESRELDKFVVRYRDFQEVHARSPKNVCGKLLFNIFSPALDQVVKTHWDADDNRAALLSRMTALPK